MFVILMLGWWYGQGWIWVGQSIAQKIQDISEDFSVDILLKTLFAPWKQIQSETTFQNFLQSSVDNFISRFIGASVRIVMLFTAFVSILAVSLFGLAFLILWPLLPALTVAVPIISLASIGS